MATKKQKAKAAIKQMMVLLLDHALRGELAPELAKLFGESKAQRDSDAVFKAQLQKGHDEWKDTKSSLARPE